jgi:hypothetical protein
MPAPPQRHIRDIVRDKAAFAHFVVHWTGHEPRRLAPRALTAPLLQQPATIGVDVVTNSGIVTEPGAAVARATVRAPVTTTGFDLEQPWSGIIAKWIASVGECAGQSIEQVQTL